jgi:superfamily II DNA or RNA helicase
MKPPSKALHPWQRECLDAIRVTAAAGGTDFLAAVTPSGGKTILGLEYARHALAADEIDAVAVLVPSINVQNYWISEAAKLRLAFSSEIGAVGAVITYQALAGEGMKVLTDLTRRKRVLVIADEIHHGGMGKPWGDAVRKATEDAVFRLGLSGTPFRTDDAEIPILRYSGDVGLPHFEHSYGDALSEGSVSPVFFRWSNGSVAFAKETISFDQSAMLGDGDNARLLTAATRANSGFSHDLLANAHSELVNCRETDPTAAGLVIAQDVPAARAALKHLTKTLKADAALVVSEDDGAHAELEAFKTGGTEWLVSVAMVSEGVDIPRLKVLAYLSNNRTELSFIQAIGRLTRLMPGRDDQRVLVHLPKLTLFEKYASGIETARKHVLAVTTSPGDPKQKFCASCGEPSPAGAASCEHCGHPFPTRTARDGTVVLNSDGFVDGLTISGRHFTEKHIDDFITLFCQSDADVADLRREGRTVWSGRQLAMLARLGEIEGLTLEDKLLSTEQALRDKGAALHEVPDDARYAGAR